MPHSFCMETMKVQDTSYLESDDVIDCDSVSIPSFPAKEVGKEFPPNSGLQRIGIELEGIGTIQMVWGRNKPDKRSVQFGDVFKRTPLLRSLSFSDEHGVYIVPEEIGDKKLIGKTAPAELVSNPHILDKRNLERLRNSIQKAKSIDPKNNFLHVKQNATLRDVRESSDSEFNLAKYTSTTRWGGHVPHKISGNLQTTIGVPVYKLLSDDKATRIKVVEMLIGDATKRQMVRDLLLAAICIERVLTDQGGVLASVTRNRDGIRLSIFMYLLNTFAIQVDPTDLQWGKNIYGAHFKGDSSFHGCGVDGVTTLLSVPISRNPLLGGALFSKVITEMSRVGLNQKFINTIKERESLFSFNQVNLGGEGLSMQTFYEDWFAIPNFIYKGKLHTVVESRERTSGLNINMAGYLNGEMTTEDFLKKLTSAGIVNI